LVRCWRLAFPWHRGLLAQLFLALFTVQLLAKPLIFLLERLELVTLLIKCATQLLHRLKQLAKLSIHARQQHHDRRHHRRHPAWRAGVLACPLQVLQDLLDGAFVGHPSR